MGKKVIVAFLSLITVLVCVISQKMGVHAAAKPDVMISSYHLEETMEFDEDTTLYVEITNMSDTYAVEGVLITYKSSNNTVLPIMGTTNQVYVSSIAPQKTTEIQVPVVIKESPDGYATVSFTIEYIVENTSMYSNESYIVFPLDGGSELNIDNINMASETNVGAKSLVGVNYSNNGNKDIKNVRMVITGVNEETIEVPVGDLAAGRSSYYEYYVVYSSEGTNNVTISMKYDDEDGKSYESNGGTYSVVVSQISVEDVEETTTIEDSATQNESEEGTYAVSISIVFLIIAAVLFAVLICLFIVRAIKNRK